MIEVVKDGIKIALNESQLGAFLNNGWTRANVNVQKSIDDVVKENEPTKVSDVAEVETPKEKTYTKSDIQLMKVSKLRELATANGIDNAENLNGVQLKEILIELLGL